jgi:uncharacterized protein (DUF1501 family)
LARRLVEAGSRFVTAAGFHGNSWDTHSNNDQGHKDRLCPPLDRTLTALVEDLEERGLLKNTLVIAMGEFGRTPTINPNLGRDHWPNCWSLALTGGGIKTGQVIGSTDEKGYNVKDRVVSMGDLYPSAAPSRSRTTLTIAPASPSTSCSSQRLGRRLCHSVALS